MRLPASAYISERFAEHLRTHEAEAEAVRVARASMGRRLSQLNELRGEVIRDRDQFVRGDFYLEQHEALRKRIETIEQFQARALGVATVLVLLAGGAGALISRLLG